MQQLHSLSPRRSENVYPYKDLYVTVHRGINHNSKIMEITPMSINWWVNRKNIYNEILFSNKRNELLIHTATWINLKNLIPSEICQSQKDKYCRIPFIWGPCCCYCLITNLIWLIFDPMDYSTPRFPVLHRLPEFAQTHVRWVGDTTQPFHFLSPLLLLPSIFPSIRIFPMRQLYISSGPSIGASASLLSMNIKGWFSLGLTGSISLL